MEFCLEQVANLKNEQNKQVLGLVVRLFGCDLIFRDMGFYMMK